MAGRDADLVRIVTDAKSPGWANVLAQGGTFTWETWAPSDADGDSTSHGWGSSVLVSLVEDVVGMTITSAGAATVSVRPPTPGTGLSYVRATLPTARGGVTVDWHLTDGGQHATLDLVVPPNMRATVRLPGRPVMTVGAGRHHLSS